MPHPSRPRDVDREAAERRDAQELAAQQELAAVRWLMDKPDGRRTVWRLLTRAGLPWDASEFEPNAMRVSYERGKAHVVFRLRELALREVPEQWLRMLSENQ